MEKNKKKKIKLISVLAVILAVVLMGSIVFSVYAEPIKCAALYSMMPDSIDGTLDDGTAFTMYKGKNSTYNKKENKGNPLAYYEFTFCDDKGGEYTVRGDETLTIGDEEIGQLAPDFLLKALETWASVKSKIITAAVILSIIIVIGLIVLWFIIWSKKQDEEKERKYGNKNNTHKKKKK